MDIDLVKTISDNEINSNIPYMYINNVKFNPNLISNYFNGFCKLGKECRNLFIKQLYAVYIDKSNNPHLTLIKEKVIDFSNRNAIFQSFIDHCNTSILLIKCIVDITQGISTLLTKHNMHVYGRFIGRVYNGLVDNVNVDFVSVLCNDADNVFKFGLDLIKTHEYKIVGTTHHSFIFIRGLNIIFKILITKETIKDYVNGCLYTEQIYITKNGNIQYTSDYLRANNNIYSMEKYDYGPVYKCFDTYYKSTNYLNDVWHEKSLTSDLIKLISTLSFKYDHRVKAEDHYLSHYSK